MVRGDVNTITVDTIKVLAPQIPQFEPRHLCINVFHMYTSLQHGYSNIAIKCVPKLCCDSPAFRSFYSLEIP